MLMSHLCFSDSYEENYKMARKLEKMSSEEMLELANKMLNSKNENNIMDGFHFLNILREKVIGSKTIILASSLVYEATDVKFIKNAVSSLIHVDDPRLESLYIYLSLFNDKNIRFLGISSLAYIGRVDGFDKLITLALKSKRSDFNGIVSTIKILLNKFDIDKPDINLPIKSDAELKKQKIYLNSWWNITKNNSKYLEHKINIIDGKDNIYFKNNEYIQKGIPCWRSLSIHPSWEEPIKKPTSKDK